MPLLTVSRLSGAQKQVPCVLNWVTLFWVVEFIKVGLVFLLSRGVSPMYTFVTDLDHL